MGFHLSPDFMEAVRDRLRDLYSRHVGGPHGYHVVVRAPEGEARLHHDPSRPGVYSRAIAAARTETTTPPAGALDNPSAPRIVEGMRCPGCKRKHTVEVVYGSVSHAGKTWARAVYTCVCCEWHDVRGQR